MMMVSVRVLKMQGKRYYTVGDRHPKILAFMNVPSAHDYVNFLERRRSIYGYFPNQSKASEVHRITIEEENLHDLQAACLNYNIGLLGVHSFMNDKFGVSMQAEELTDDLGLFPVNPRDLLEWRRW